MTLFYSVTHAQWKTAPVPITYDYYLLDRIPHDTQAFTQGLIIQNGIFYESTGLYGQSSLRKVDATTGKVIQQKNLHRRYFGEGLTLFNDQLFQLTWRSQKGFVYDANSLKRLKTFPYPLAGWGLTHNNKHLIMSNGSNTLYFLDTNNFSIVKTLKITAANRTIRNLNELEYINGYIFANIWKSNEIAKIDPQSGYVVGWIDLSKLAKQEAQKDPENVLNGIAFDHHHKHLFITGKRWSHYYKIQLTSPEEKTKMNKQINDFIKRYHLSLKIPEILKDTHSELIMGVGLPSVTMSAIDSRNQKIEGQLFIEKIVHGQLQNNELFLEQHYPHHIPNKRGFFILSKENSQTAEGKISLYTLHAFIQISTPDAPVFYNQLKETIHFE